MTNEEVERAIDFLLKSQATSEARIDRLSEQVSQLSSNVDRLRDNVGQLGGTVDRLSGTVDRLSGTVGQLADHLNSFADTQANVMRVMMQTFEAQARINEDLREGQASMRTAIVELAGRQSQTEEAMARLADTQSNSDRRLDALIRVVEEDRRGRQ
jgi:methyl-accepting chemotaxis protein